MEAKENVTPRAWNMLLPIITMVLMMPVMLVITGWQATSVDTPLLGRVVESIGNGSGSTAVLYAVITAVVMTGIWYRVQGIMKTSEIVNVAFQGIGGLIPIALLMLFAFAIGNVCQELGTGNYVAQISKNWLSPGLIPMLLFIVSGFIAFATGTSWGTFAIMIAIAVPISQSLGASLYMSIAAVMGGGVFGDHCSPISDTTILSSMAAATDHIDHVKTQLPYALAMGLISAIFYLLAGTLGLGE
jgi:Na+/H+ antiporter NhaC